MPTFSRILLVPLLADLLAVSTVPAASAHAGNRRPRTGVWVGHENPPEPNGLDKVVIKFGVVKGGTRIKRFRMVMNTICSYGTYLDLQYVNQPMPTAKIAKNGRFRSVLKETYNGQDIDVTVSGRFVGNRVRNGKIDYNVGICVRTATWSARRK